MTRQALRRHTIPGTDFDAIATGSGSMAGLRAGQRSRRLVMVSEVASRVRAQSPDLFHAAGVAESLAVLAEAQADTSAADEVLLHPHVGAWAAHCLRSMLRPGGRASAEDVGHLGAIAISAAWHGRRRAEATCYVREGSLVLPGMGAARAGGGNAWCRVRADPTAGGLEVTTPAATTIVGVTSDDSTVWSPMRRLRSPDGFELCLDDLDPYRCGGEHRAAPRLGAHEVAAWQAAFVDAWTLVSRHQPEAAAAMPGSLVVVVPLEASDPWPQLSATRHEAVGALAMTPPRGALDLALGLVHEFHHTKLSALLDLAPIVDRDPGHRFHAPWRRDPRPLRGLLQGTYAFLGLTVFWESYRRHAVLGRPGGDARAHFEFAMLREQVSEAVATLRSSGCLTAAGSRFVGGMERRSASLRREPVPTEPRRLARLACLDNATSWRLRNLAPPPDVVSDWADAWLHGMPFARPPSAASAPVDGGGPLPSDARLAAMRRRLAPPPGRASGTGDSTADDLLLCGQVEAAIAAYRRQIAEAPDDLGSWAGLALARRGCAGAASALVTHPEDVRALHRCIRSRTRTLVDPERLAAWMAGAGTA